MSLMTSVDLVKHEQTLMLRCPKCNWRFPVNLPAFCLATEEGKYISCVACGSDFHVRVALLARATELRNEADTGGQPCPECDGMGYKDPKWSGWKCINCDGTGQV